MMTARGKLFVIEGGDGSGKATQAELTRQYAADVLHKKVLKRSFPRYGEESAELVERYLNGEFGGLNAVPPEFVAQAFALDRLAGTPEIAEHLAKGLDYIAILDRYDGSNVAHQGAKFPAKNKRHAFYDWIQRFEASIGMLKADKHIVLLVPSHISHQNVANKNTRSYTDKTHDIHEEDIAYQERVKQAYEELCELYPDKYTPIICVDDVGNMRSREAIQLDIRAALGI